MSIKITSACIYCPPKLADKRVIKDSTTIDRDTINKIVDQWDDSDFPDDIEGLAASVVAAGIGYILRGGSLGDTVKVQVESLMSALKAGLVDALIGLGLYKLLKNEVSLSSKTKKSLRKLSGSDFKLDFELTYRQSGSNDGAYWITDCTLSEK
ncbi:hypothetical protein [Tepidibacter formicigenes]|jgi:hypothetical protein|uniref:Uncharacterized protein n=1 Tax=Tepidibacter formicigenes DSM 15518 TaxID=1123349 RepID=A0A1M6SAX5_9FIRM|nr:hypothetical protein [Tepidibacter formicigenes]SHK41846.1 hypothetical protein SAMN02744037_02300 [Tepidibacter formicigenes DSM 15518]